MGTNDDRELVERWRAHAQRRRVDADTEDEATYWLGVDEVLGRVLAGVEPGELRRAAPRAPVLPVPDRSSVEAP